MVLLILGVVLWSGTHLIRGIAPSARDGLVARIGEGPYRGLFSLTLVASIVSMVLGWQSAPRDLIYLPPMWGRSAALVLMLIALVLFAASGVPTNIKRLLRHPQLTGVVIWAIAHLLANGDSRSVVLFSGIGLWALVEMALINRRNGPWEKPASLPLSVEVKPLIAGVVAYLVLFFAHPYIAGVSPLAM